MLHGCHDNGSWDLPCIKFSRSFLSLVSLLFCQTTHTRSRIATPRNERKRRKTADRVSSHLPSAPLKLETFGWSPILVTFPISDPPNQEGRRRFAHAIQRGSLDILPLTPSLDSPLRCSADPSPASSSHSAVHRLLPTNRSTESHLATHLDLLSRKPTAHQSTLGLSGQDSPVRAEPTARLIRRRK